MIREEIIKVITSIVWVVFGCTAFAVSCSLFWGEKLSISFQGNSINTWLSLIYTGLGVIFFLQSVATYYLKKVAILLPIPFILFSLMASYDEMVRIIDGGLVIYKYLIMYISIFFVCTVTILLIAKNWFGSDENNA